MRERDDYEGRLRANLARRAPIPSEDLLESVLATTSNTTQQRASLAGGIFASIGVRAVLATAVLLVAIVTGIQIARSPVSGPAPAGVPSGSVNPTASPTGTPMSPTQRPSPTSTARAEATEGDWQLVLEVGRGQLSAEEPITVQTTLTYTGSQPTMVAWGPNFGFVGFELMAADSSTHLVSGGDTDCVRHDFVRGQPVSFAFVKPSEFISGDQPPSWITAFLADPQFRLPAGSWELSAAIRFSPGGSLCSADQVSLVATVRLTVTP